MLLASLQHQGVRYFVGVFPERSVFAKNVRLSKLQRPPRRQDVQHCSQNRPKSDLQAGSRQNPQIDSPANVHAVLSI